MIIKTGKEEDLEQKNTTMSFLTTGFTRKSLTRTFTSNLNVGPRLVRKDSNLSNRQSQKEPKVKVGFPIES